MQVFDCIGTTMARRRSLLAAELSLEWALTVPSAFVATVVTEVGRIVEQDIPALLQNRGFSVTGASVSVSSRGQTVPTVEVVDYETGEVFSDDIAPVIALLGEQLTTLQLPIPDDGWGDPGWTAMDNVDGDISARCRVKFMNRTVDFLDVTRPGRPLVMRCEPCPLYQSLDLV